MLEPRLWTIRESEETDVTTKCAYHESRGRNLWLVGMVAMLALLLADQFMNN